MHSWAMPGQCAPAVAAPRPPVDAAQLLSLLLSQPALAQQLHALTNTLSAERPAAAPWPQQQLGHALGHSERSAFQPPSSVQPPQLPAAAVLPGAPPPQLAGQGDVQVHQPGLSSCGLANLASAIRSMPGLSEAQRACLMQKLGAQLADLPGQGGSCGGAPAPATGSGASAATANLRVLLAQYAASGQA